MSDNKLVKSLMDAAVLTKKVLKMSFTADPSNSFENFGKFTAVMAGSIAAKQYLEDQNIIKNTI